MRIYLDKAYVPQAGDILSWTSGKDKILFVVLTNVDDKMVGVSLFDNRGHSLKVHLVVFNGDKFNYRLSLICKKDRANFDLDQILEDWVAKDE